MVFFQFRNSIFQYEFRYFRVVLFNSFSCKLKIKCNQVLNVVFYDAKNTDNQLFQSAKSLSKIDVVH